MFTSNFDRYHFLIVQWFLKYASKYGRKDLLKNHTICSFFISNSGLLRPKNVIRYYHISGKDHLLKDFLVEFLTV